MVQSNLDEFDDHEDDTKAKMLPAHDIVQRSHVTVFSAVEGVAEGWAIAGWNLF